MAANFLKANNHQQGKIFFNSYKSSPYFISRQNSSCPAHPPGGQPLPENGKNRSILQHAFRASCRAIKVNEPALQARTENSETILSHRLFY